MNKTKIHAKSPAGAVIDGGVLPQAPPPSPGGRQDASRGRGSVDRTFDAGQTPRRRRIPLSAIALVGAILAAAYGHLILGMRLTPPLVMVAIGGMTLALCADALWRVIDPLTRDEVAAVVEMRAPHRIRELEREKQAVLKAIKEIELDHQMRKISTADYREMVERYRARALRILGDLAVGDDYRALIERELRDRLAARIAATGDDEAAATAAPAEATASIAPAALTCAACGVINVADARFCNKCGSGITTSADLA